MENKEVEQTDVLVIGGGIAGIRAAIEAHDKGVNVILANKGPFGRDGAAVWMAGWGFQAALYHPDSIEQHIADTIKGGKFLNNQELVKTFLSLAPKALEEISKWGMRLAKEGDKFMQARLPGETYARSIYHVHFGKMLGAEYKKILPRQVKKRKKIHVIEDIIIFDLLKNGDEVVGAIGLDLVKGTPVVINAKATIVATGGYMGCYNFTTANSTATGDGHGFSYRAGVKMTGMEFVQFIPTVTLWPQIVRGDLFPYSLLNAVYGMFFNKMGERFMERYYPKEKDWATREAASRAIAQEVREGRGSPHGGAYLSFKHIPKNLMDTFLETNKESSFMKNLERTGFNIREDALEVGPGAHYVQGGCWIDEKCRTNLGRLYAIGELGSGGKDGADRLAGNSLPFCMVMGYVAGKEAAKNESSGDLPEIDKTQVDRLTKKVHEYFDRTDGVRPKEIKVKVRGILGEYAIFQRNAEGLKDGIKQIEDIKTEMLPKLSCAAKTKTFNLEWMEALEAENIVDVAEMILRSALMREESRGLHERSDFPEKDEKWLKHLIIKKVDEKMSFSAEPITFPHVKLE
ncbi:MAG: FAD-binding protein [Thermodesulfobacteriota bacterium]|nr:FAD-binding protein [Thermodesulfobacteriota bacterium]